LELGSVGKGALDVDHDRHERNMAQT